MHPLSFKGMPALSFNVQGDEVELGETVTHTRSHTAMLLHFRNTKEETGEMPYHFSHWSSIQPSPPSPPESILLVRRASKGERRRKMSKGFGKYRRKGG